MTSANIDAVLARLDEMNNGEINYEVYRELHNLVSAIEDDVQAPIELLPGTLEALDALSIRARTASPDAATEGDYHEGLEEGIKIGRAERDAALAAIERVREEHQSCYTCTQPHCFRCKEAMWPCATFQALDGVPNADEWRDDARVATEDDFPYGHPELDWEAATIIKLEAERDAALAAIERVRAVLANDELVWSDGSYTNDLVVEVKDVLAALDGAPEPEVKP